MGFTTSNIIEFESPGTLLGGVINKLNAVGAYDVPSVSGINGGVVPKFIGIKNTAGAPVIISSTGIDTIYVTEGVAVTSFQLNDGEYIQFEADSPTTLISTSRDATSITNRIIIKKESDFPPPITGVITLESDKKYLLDGAITITNKIDCNSALVYGIDSRKDKLINSETNGVIFTGANSVRVFDVELTADGTSGKVFDLDGGGSGMVMIKGSRITSCTEIGTIDSYSTVMFCNVSYRSNAVGIEFIDIGRLCGMCTDWYSSNTATTFETLTGAFDVIHYGGGVNDIPSGKTGIDISGITSVTCSATIEDGEAFVGDGTYVDDETIFQDKEWNVSAAGLSRVYRDDSANGGLSKDGSTTTTISTINTPVKITGDTTLSNALRVDDDSATDNKLRYTGLHTRDFHVVLNASIDSSGINKNYSLYIAKNGSVISSTKSIIRVIAPDSIGSLSTSTTIEMANGDYLEGWIECNTDDTDVIVETMNFHIK